MSQEKPKRKHRHSKTHRIIKSIRYFFGLRILKLFFSLPYFIPLSWALTLSSFIVKFGYYFAGEYRRQALTNLKLYYGKEKSYAELKDMAIKVGIEATKGGFETIYSVSPRKEELYSKIEIEGKEHLDAAIRQGKGVIALSAHLGNFAVMGGKLISEGYPFHLVLKLPKDPGIAEYFKMKMEQYYFKFIVADHTTVSQKEIIRCLRRNGVACLIADYDQKMGGVPVNLMAQEIAMPPGPAILARRTGAAVLPMLIIRQEDNSQKITIDPPIEIFEDESPDQAISLLCQRFASIIESYICKYPTQWYWVNKKHQDGWLRKKHKKDTFEPEKPLSKMEIM